MGCPVLIASPTLEWGEEIKKYLSGKDIASEIVSNGKECQLKAHQGQKDFVVLDIETKANSSIEVLQYLRRASPQTKVILIAENKGKISELAINEEDLRKLGAYCVLIKPFQNDDILEQIDPIRGSVEKVSTGSTVTEDDFKTFVLLHNDLRIMQQSGGKLMEKLRLIASIVEQQEALLMNEVLRAKTITFSKETAFLIAEVLDNEEDFADFLKAGDLLSQSPTFQILLFSVMTAQFIDWTSRRTLETLIHAILLREVGKITEKIPLDFWPDDTTLTEKLVEFRLHPWQAVVYLAEYENVPEPVKQIVYQRHEFVNASGFPLGIPGNRIYPPAKILSLAEHFARFIGEKNLSPLDGLKEFMQDRAPLDRFDPLAIKGLIKAFITKSKKQKLNGKI